MQCIFTFFFFLTTLSSLGYASSLLEDESKENECSYVEMLRNLPPTYKNFCLTLPSFSVLIDNELFYSTAFSSVKIKKSSSKSKLSKSSSSANKEKDKNFNANIDAFLKDPSEAPLPLFSAPAPGSDKFIYFAELLKINFPEIEKQGFFTDEKIKTHLELIARQTNCVLLGEILDFNHVKLDRKNLLSEDYYLEQIYQRVALEESDEAEDQERLAKEEAKSKEGRDKSAFLQETKLKVKFNFFVNDLYEEKSFFVTYFYSVPQQAPEKEEGELSSLIELSPSKLATINSGVEKEISSEILLPKIDYIKSLVKLVNIEAKSIKTSKDDPRSYIAQINKFLQLPEENQKENHLTIFKTPLEVKWREALLEKYQQQYSRKAIEETAATTHHFIGQLVDVINLCLTQHLCSTKLIISPQLDARYELLRSLCSTYMKVTYSTILETHGNIFYSFLIEKANQQFEEAFFAEFEKRKILYPYSDNSDNKLKKKSKNSKKKKNKEKET